MTPPKAPEANFSQPQGLIVLTGESTVARAVRAALAGLEGTGPLIPGSGAIELIAPDQKRRPLLTSAVTDVRRELAARYPDVPIVRRPGSPDVDGDPKGWHQVSTPDGTERFDGILVPAWWSRFTRRCLVTVVSRSDSAPRLSPMLTLARFAHPRQRLAVRFHPRRFALAAELAAPWRVDLCVVAASRPPFKIVAATRDLIAAELVWLALSARDADTEDVGPWEDATVQHATQLGMGVLGPHQVVIRTAHDAPGWDLPDLLATRVGVAPHDR